MVYDTVVDTLCDQLDLDENDISMDSSLVDDLDIDSITYFEIIMEYGRRRGNRKRRMWWKEA